MTCFKACLFRVFRTILPNLLIVSGLNIFYKNGHESVFSVFTRLKYDLRVETWLGEPENAQKMFIKASRHDPCIPFL